jgi:hypothetical protein
VTTMNRSILAPCILAMALLASCQSTQKAENEPATTTATTKTAPATNVVMTPVEVEGSQEAKPSSDKKDGDKTKGSDAGAIPASTPTSEYAADRLRDMEKGLRRLQSLPSAKAKPTGRSRGKFDL